MGSTIARAGARTTGDAIVECDPDGRCVMPLLARSVAAIRRNLAPHGTWPSVRATKTSARATWRYWQHGREAEARPSRGTGSETIAQRAGWAKRSGGDRQRDPDHGAKPPLMRFDSQVDVGAGCIDS